MSMIVARHIMILDLAQVTFKAPPVCHNIYFMHIMYDRQFHAARQVVTVAMAATLNPNH
jgi:hypothetical protein